MNTNKKKLDSSFKNIEEIFSIYSNYPFGFLQGVGG